MDKAGRSASRTVEFAYDDWCIAQMAKALNQNDDYEVYTQRSGFYKNIYDKSMGFIRGKDTQGRWKDNFNPNQTTGEFVEGNSWHYSFFAPHDPQGLMDQMGGDDKFAGRLDELFAAEGKEHMDISGLIGQYAHGNEPCHNYAYLYAYAGQHWKTQEKVARIVRELYAADPDGICGNEDCGQMSAWYVFSAMGFYPVCPGQVIYVFGTPLFPHATINLENGNKFEIIANNVSEQNIYIQSATLNGKAYSKAYLEHAAINAGGKLTFQMGPNPNKNWGKLKQDRPYANPGKLASTRPNPKISKNLITSNNNDPAIGELTGQIKIPVSGTYTFTQSSDLGRAKVFMDNQCVAQDDITAGFIKAGIYALKVQGLYPMLNNPLQVQVKVPNTNEFVDLDTFILPQTQQLEISKLAEIPAEAIFIDPALIKHVSLATGKPVSCSGGTQMPHTPDKTVDADISNNSGWHCGSGPQWLQVDLGKVYDINRIKVYTYYDNNRYYKYAIEVSTDGSEFTRVVDERGNTTPSTASGFEHSINPVKARYVKLHMISNSANPGVHVNELLVFGSEMDKE
ncbi:MAG: GH92 family glycosyl hydrolase [Phycisphaerae bacterium]|nr:GH92 family glycosyl hydrolase [Phycisphaerae bacterium]